MKLNKSERFEMRMDFKTKQRLEMYAQEQGLTLSEAVETLIWKARVSKKLRRGVSDREMMKYIWGIR